MAFPAVFNHFQPFSIIVIGLSGGLGHLDAMDAELPPLSVQSRDLNERLSACEALPTRLWCRLACVLGPGTLKCDEM